MTRTRQRKRQKTVNTSEEPKVLPSETQPQKRWRRRLKKTKVSISTPEDTVKEFSGISETLEITVRQTHAKELGISEAAETLEKRPLAEELPGISKAAELSEKQTPAKELPRISEAIEPPDLPNPAKELPGISKALEVHKEQTDEKQHNEHSNEGMKPNENQTKENSNDNKNNQQLDQNDKVQYAKPDHQKNGELGGVVFMCNAQTKPDCYRYMVMGFPDSKRELVMKIRPGSRLFLYDYNLKILHGIYKAASPGGMRVEPAAFNGSFPAQVRFKIDKECPPLPLSSLGEFSENLGLRVNLVKSELSIEQVEKLIDMFIKNTADPRALAFHPNAQAGANAFVPPRPFVPGQTLRPHHLGGLHPQQIMQTNFQLGMGAAARHFAPPIPQVFPVPQMVPPLRPQFPMPTAEDIRRFYPAPLLRGPVPIPAEVSLHNHTLASKQMGSQQNVVPAPKATAPSLTDVALANLSVLSTSYRRQPVQPQPSAQAPAVLSAPHNQLAASAPVQTPVANTQSHTLISDVARLGSQQRLQLASSEDRRYHLTQATDAVGKSSDIPFPYPLKSKETIYRGRDQQPGQSSPIRGLQYSQIPVHGMDSVHGLPTGVYPHLGRTEHHGLDNLSRMPAVTAANTPLDYTRRHQQLGSNMDVDSLPVSSRYSFDGPSVKYQ